MSMMTLVSDLARGFSVDRWWKMYEKSLKSRGHLNTIELLNI